MLRLPYKLRRTEGRPCRIPYWGGFRYKIECLCENLYIKLSSLPKTGINLYPHGVPKVIVSMTTYPARIDAAYYAIKSLMLQTHKADRIILWLARSQFDKIPEKLESLMDKGLEIRFCEDLKSHKKYFFALRQQLKNEVIITYDDDIIYERDSIAKLVNMHIKHPGCIICNRAQKINFNESEIKPYKTWAFFNKVKAGIPVLGMVPSTGNGCLYPYGVMPQSAFDIKTISENALTADDLWIAFNSINNKIPIVKTLDTIPTLVTVGKSQRASLTQINDIGGENQRTINRLLELFPKTLQLLHDAN